MNPSSAVSSRPPAPTIFIGNIPYDLTEAALVELFQQIGPVKSFRLVNDRDTGMAKGYGFCEYYDTTTAESAVRNLNNHELNGRSIRVDFADEHVTKQVGTKQVTSELNRNQGVRDDSSVRQKEEMWMKEQPIGMDVIRQAACKMAFLLGGRDVVLGSTPPTAGSNLQIYAILSEMKRKEMYEILAGMKDVVQRNYGYAKTMLVQNPQLSRTLFLMEIALGIVEAPELPEESANYDGYQDLDLTQVKGGKYGVDGWNKGLDLGVQDVSQISFPPLILNAPPRPMQPMTALEQGSNPQVPTVLPGVIQTPSLVTPAPTGLNIQLQNPTTPTFAGSTNLTLSTQEAQQVISPHFQGSLQGTLTINNTMVMIGVSLGVHLVAPTGAGHALMSGIPGSQQNQILAAVNQPLIPQPQPMVPMSNMDIDGETSMQQSFSPTATTTSVFGAQQDTTMSIAGDDLDEQIKNQLNQVLSLTKEQVDLLPPEQRDQVLAIQRQCGKIA